MTTGKRLPTEFGKRQPAPLPPVAGPKRSNHVALLVMGTLAVGGGAYALTGENCQPTSPGMATTPSSCTSRGGSGGSGGSSRYGFFGSSGSPSLASETSGGVTRGGFGSFAHAFGFGGRS